MGPGKEARPLRDGRRSWSFGLKRRLDREHRALALEPPVIAVQRTIAAQNAMTRNEPGDRIASDGRTHRTRGARIADASSDGAIGRDLALRNREERLPDLHLPRCAEQMDGEVAVAGLGLEDPARDLRR